jgi:hypothetical protein
MSLTVAKTYCSMIAGVTSSLAKSFILPRKLTNVRHNELLERNVCGHCQAHPNRQSDKKSFKLHFAK